MSAKNREGYTFSEETKKEVLKLQQNRCENCGEKGTKKEPLTCHHRIKIDWAKNNLENIEEVRLKIKSIENATYLCHDCHKKEHENEENYIYELLSTFIVGSNYFTNSEIAQKPDTSFSSIFMEKQGKKIWKS